MQDSEINEFCTGGCYDHTLLIFKCIQDVKRDFYFATKAPYAFVKNATMNACNELKGNTVKNIHLKVDYFLIFGAKIKNKFGVVLIM